MYSVVQFTASDGGTISVVNSQWLTPRKWEVYWPPFAFAQRHSSVYYQMHQITIGSCTACSVCFVRLVSVYLLLITYLRPRSRRRGAARGSGCSAVCQKHKRWHSDPIRRCMRAFTRQIVIDLLPAQHTARRRPACHPASPWTGPMKASNDCQECT